MYQIALLEVNLLSTEKSTACPSTTDLIICMVARRYFLVHCLRSQSNSQKKTNTKKQKKKQGFHHQNWSEESLLVDEHNASLTLSYTSADGEEVLSLPYRSTYFDSPLQGYPGTMHVSTTYTLHHDGLLRIDWHATADAATPVNLTNVRKKNKKRLCVPICV